MTQFDHIGNFRDVGGHVTSDGSRMRKGKVFRSGHLANATDRDLALLAELDIGLVVDLRDSMDVAVDGEGRLPAGSLLRRVGYSGEVLGGDIQGLLAGADAQAIEQAFPPGSAYAIVLESCAKWSCDEGRMTQLTEVIRSVIDAERALLIQCSAGKDRTGFASAVLQASVGVPVETVIADYLRSNDARATRNTQMLESLGSRGVATELIEPLLVLREDYIRVFLKTIEDDWGGINGFVRHGLGVDEREVVALRRRLLDR